MFISLGQRVDTDTDYTRIFCTYHSRTGEYHPARIHLSFGFGNSLLLDITEARALALELEQALRDAWSDDAEGIE